MKENQFWDEPGPGKTQVDFVLSRKSTQVPALVHVGPDTPISEVIALMDEYNISQIPVLRGNDALGNLTEGKLSRRILEDPSLLSQNAEDVMEASLPVLEAEKTLDIAMKILTQRSSALLVKRHGVLVGVVTRHDLIAFLSEGRRLGTLLAG